MSWSQLNGVIARTLAFLYPPRCGGCRLPGEVFCANCRPSPSQALSFYAGGAPARALGSYAGTLRRAVLAFKNGRRDLAAEFAALLTDRAADLLVPGRVLIPVPTTGRRRGARGFDQGELLAREVERASGVPALALLRQTAGDGQRGRSRSRRLAAQGRFALRSASLVRGLAVLLVDDVATTGATLRDCAATLERAGARVEGALVIARAERVRTN